MTKEETWARRAEEFLAEWRAVIFATAPADRGQVERIVSLLYREFGEAKPTFCWVDGLGVTLEEIVGARRVWPEPIGFKMTLGFLRAGFFLCNPAGVPASALVAGRDAAEVTLAREAFARVFGPLNHGLMDLRLFLQRTVALGTSLLDSRQVRRPERNHIFARPLFFGSMETPDFEFIEFVERHLGPVFEAGYRAQVCLWLELARSGFWWTAYDGLCVACERPEIFTADEAHRLHCADGPALRLRDGVQVHALFGSEARPEWVNPVRPLPMAEILSQPNPEARQWMIERHGAARFLREAGAVMVARDGCGTLYRLPGRLAALARERFVEVVNSTPEPDGSHKTHLLSVPPAMQTARQAVAWTFGLRAEDYSPVMET